MDSDVVPPPDSVNNAAPSVAPVPPTTPPEPPKHAKKPNKWVLIGALVVLVIATAVCLWVIDKPTPAPVATTVTVTKKTTAAVKAQGLVLDPSKNYGNKYADGLLPVGDNKYSSTTASVGNIYTCATYAHNLTTAQGGAGSRGPWFANNNTQYDINKKLHVQGSILWQASFTNNVSGATRTIITNDLPDHPTGVFPISAADPAYAYDRNPNKITGQTMTYALSAAPSYSATPNCMGGQVGVMLTGVALFNGFDAGGRDAGAWEVQDSCDGHPQSDGIYHYHTLSSCIKDTSVKTVIGFALDGFPITGPQVGTNNVLTTADLDVCHGLTSQIVLDGKNVTMYHYVMTQDFPYSVSCFRSIAINPPGQPSGPPQGNQ